MRRARGAPALAFAACGASLAGVAAGCGAAGGGAQGLGFTIATGYPSQPSTGECRHAADALRFTTGRSTQRPPRPGIYRYAVRGSDSNDGHARSLPAESRLVVSGAAAAGSTRCMNVQTRLHDSVATATVVLYGNRAYTLRMDMAAPRFSVRFDPRQPIPTPDPGQLQASGTVAGTVRGRVGGATFSGPAVGSYAGEVVGRKRLRVGSALVPVVGVEVRSSWRGANFSTRERSTNWLALTRRLMVAQTVEQERTSNGDRYVTRYTARLESLRPTPCCVR